MLKKLLPLLFAGFLAFNFTACGSSGDSASDTPPANSTDYTAMSGEVYSAVSIAMTSAIAAPAKMTITSPGTGTINCTGTGWTATGDYSLVGDVYTYNIHFEWNGFTSGGVTLNSGTIDLIYEMNTSTGNLTYDYTGDFEVVYNAVTYTMGWDISIAVAGGKYTYEGTYSVNGSPYTWSYSAK